MYEDGRHKSARYINAFVNSSRILYIQSACSTHSEHIMSAEYCILLYSCFLRTRQDNLCIFSIYA
jgi:hypothetical protein